MPDKLLDSQQERLIDECEVGMDYSFEGWQEPTLLENLARAGVSRKDFLKFCGGLAAVFAAKPVLGLGGARPAQAAGAATPTPTAEEIADALGNVQKPLAVWLQLQECTGCMESALRSGENTVEDVALSLISLNYNELVMAAAGDAANEALRAVNEQPHILVVNGSVPLADGGIYCTIGGESTEQVLRDAARNATAVLAVGACSVWGSVQAAHPNPTGAVGVDHIIRDKPVINVAGCPPIGEIIMASIAYLLTYGSPPEVDRQGRPLFAYDQRIHDNCPRRAHFDAGQYVRNFDDVGARNGWCLYEVGCKGPETFSPCPIIQWNQHTNWPIGSGNPCIGCTELHFFDRYTPFYSVLPHVPGLGVEATAERVGAVALGATAALLAVHGGITAFRAAAAKRAIDKAPLAAFGDAPTAVPLEEVIVESAPVAPVPEVVNGVPPTEAWVAPTEGGGPRG